MRGGVFCWRELERRLELILRGLHWRVGVEVLKSGPFVLLDITSDHAFAVGGLPLHHRDPFDRMLIAQAQAERLTLVTRDPQIRRYDLPIIVA